MASDSVILVEQVDGVSVVTIGSEFEHLDDLAVLQYQDLLLSTASDADPPSVLIDLTNVTLFGSSFIEVVFRVWHRLNARDGSRFGLCGVSEYCREVLNVTHLDHLWQIYPDRQTGIEGFSDG